MCLFIILLFFGPRTVIAIWWLVQPLRWVSTAKLRSPLVAK
jgi:hypothetical protein